MEETSKSSQFIHELAQFYRNKGQFGVTSKHLSVRLDGQDIDLWELYSSVIDLGGSFKVNQQSLWEQVYIRVFKKRPSGVNTSVALRQVYQKYLMPYERVHCSNFIHDNTGDDEDDSKSIAQINRDQVNSYVIHSSLTHHPQSLQHQQLQQQLLSMGPNPVTKLICSLVSGLSNEMDFALKIVTMLVNSRNFNAIADYRFIDILLEACHLNICSCDHERLPLTLDALKRHHRHHLLRSPEKDSSRGHSSSSSSLYATKKCLCFQRFWSSVCRDPFVLSLVFEDSLGDNINDASSNQSEEPITVLPEDNGHLSLDEEQVKKSEMIKRIADLIRSITEFMQDFVDSEEDPILDPAPLRLVKFVVLLLSSSNSEMKSLGLDIASNISLIPNHSSDSHLYLSLESYISSRCISFMFEDSDTDVVIRSLSCLSHMISSAGDEIPKTIKESLDSGFLTRLIELLTSQHDISLMIAALEVCWSISEVSPKLLLSSESTHLIKILLNLINCDVNSYFSKDALKRIRLSDSHQRTLNQVTSQVLVNPVTGNNSKPVMTCNPVVHSSTASESEAFLISWLKNTFDVTPGKTGTVISMNDIFAAYLKFACNSGRRSVINAQSFSQVIIKAFPSVSCNGSHVEGIVPKVVSPVVHVVPAAPVSVPPSLPSIPASSSTPKKISPNIIITNEVSSTENPDAKNPLTSPILKAHLSAPPKTSPSGQSSSTTTPSTATSTTTSGTTPTSSLIKSLLASKLRNNTVSTKLDFSDPSSDPSSPVVKNEPNSESKTEISSASMTSTASITVTPSIPMISTPSKINVVSSVMTSNSNVIITSTSSSSSMSLPQAILTSSCSQQVLISTPTMTNSVIGGQPAPQQFLLVRTIMPGGGQGSLMGMPTTGPVRLILPASVLTQQRPVPQAVNVNGVFNSNAISVPTTTTTVSTVTPQVNPTPPQTGSDILLKAVLGSGIGSETSTSASNVDNEARNCIKSSPLLNVLLDKGTSGQSSSSQLSPSLQHQQQPSQQVSQQPKMFILTTKPGVAVKPPPQSSEAIQVALKNGSDPLVNNIHSNQKTPATPGATIVNCSLNLGHPLTNGDVTDELCLDEKKLNQSSSDLSPIKDIHKTMDEATKQMKRPNEDNNNKKTPSKKSKKSKKEVTSEDSTSEPSPVTVSPVTGSPVTGSPVSQKPVNGDIKTSPKASPVIVSDVTVTAVQPTTSEATESSSVTVTPSVSVTPGPLNGHVTPVTPPAVPVSAVQTSPPKLEFICEWNGCKKAFFKATQVFKHVYETHVFLNCTAKTASNEVMSCEWGGPHGMGPGCQSKRPKLSLLTHLQDFHCNPNLLHQTAIKRIQLGAPPTVNVALSQPPPAHPGYAKNAAYLAIKRHAVNYIEPWPTLTQTPTTPVTVSIRLTAALILRNLASVSGDIRRCLQRHEGYLSEVTISFGRDESRTIAQCLAIIQSSGWKR